MSEQLTASLVTTAVTIVIATLRLLTKLTIHGRAESQLHRADLFRRAGVIDEAEEHTRRARRFLLRPVVMEERGLIGTLACADIAAVGLLLLAAVVGIVSNLSVPAGLVAFGLTLGALLVMFLDSSAIERECRARAATYDHPARETTAGGGSSPRQVRLTYLAWILLCLRR